MLQINNILHALAKARHSPEEIMKSAMGLPAGSWVNNDNNIYGFLGFGAGFQGNKAQWRE
jgi:hypothetical protein